MAMLQISFWLCFGVCQIVLSENLKKEENAQFRETDRVSDPVRGFFSEIGNLFLDVDETVSKQTAPKVNLENLVKEQLYLGFRRPPQEYFMRIQENYKDINKRLGSSISQIMDGILTPSEVQKNDLKDKDVKTTMDIAIESDWKQDTKDETDSKVLSQSQQDRLRKAFDGIFKAVSGSIALKTTNSDKETSQFQPLKETWEEFRKRIDSIPKESKIIPTEEEIKVTVNRFVKNVPFSQDILTAIRRDSNDFSSRSGDLLEENKNVPIDDFIQSKTTFEKYLQNLLENQGKGFLQPRFKSQTIQTETPEEIAESPAIDFTPDTVPELLPTSTEPISTTDSLKLSSEETFESKLSSIPPLYEVNAEDVVELVLEPESTTEMTQELRPDYTDKPKGIEILAFTPDGVPLKLRMDDEIENPLLFLHKALSSADVFLNIPVESFDDLEPAGKEVLQLGTGSIGTVTRALYLDLSNEYELKSLLKTLRMTQNIRRY